MWCVQGQGEGGYTWTTFTQEMANPEQGRDVGIIDFVMVLVFLGDEGMCSGECECET